MHTVGISDMKTSTSTADVLVTYSLGSCVGVTAFDPVAGVGGMVHCMLPLSKMDAKKAQANPYMFTDTGVVGLLNKVFELGASKKNLVIKVAGASSMLDQKELFKIGKRNYTVLRKVLWKNDLLIAAEDTGGTKPRTMFLHMEDGRTTIKSGGEESEL